MSWWMLVPILFLAFGFVWSFVGVCVWRDGDRAEAVLWFLGAVALFAACFFTSGGVTACGSFVCGST